MIWLFYLAALLVFALASNLESWILFGVGWALLVLAFVVGSLDKFGSPE